MDKRKRKYPIEYRVSGCWRLLYLSILPIMMYIYFIIIGIWAISILSMIIDIVTPWNMILSLMLAFIPYVVISSFWQHLDMIFRNKLLVTDEGIWLTQTHRYFFSWQSLEELGYHPKSKFAKQVDWGIRAVGANHIQYSPIGRFLLNGRNCDKFIPLYYFVEIPISPFWLWQRPDVEKFRETEFGQILYDHAPHLFEDDNERKLKNRLDDDYSDNEQPYWDDDGQIRNKQYV